MRERVAPPRRGRTPHRRYCEYGAVSQAQLDGCLDHVTAGRIQQLETQAALYDGVAPPVVLAACHERALEIVRLEDLGAYAVP